MRTNMLFGVLISLGALLTGLVGSTLLAPTPARAAAKSWIGGSGLWDNPDMWSPAGVPSGSDGVFITADGTYTVTVSGGTRSANTITNGAAGNTGVQTVVVDGAGTYGISPTAANGITNYGVITLETSSGTPYAYLTVTTGALTNHGTFNSNAGTGGGRQLAANLVNNGTVNVNVNTAFSKPAGSYTNNGSFNIAAGQTLEIAGGGQVFTQAGGTLAVPGTFDMTSATFNFNGGTVTGMPQLMSSTLNIGAGSAGAGTFSMRGASDLSGNVSLGQTILVDGVGTYGTNLTAATGFNNAGTITLETTGGSTAYAYLTVTTGILTNTGTININPGSGGGRQLAANLVNNGTLNINTNAAFNKASGSYTNNGSFNIAAGRTLEITGGSQGSPGEAARWPLAGPSI